LSVNAATAVNDRARSQKLRINSWFALYFILRVLSMTCLLGAKENVPVRRARASISDRSGTSMLDDCATGSAGGGVLSDPLICAATPALRAMIRTTIRAVLIRFTIHIYAETLELHVVTVPLKVH